MNKKARVLKMNHINQKPTKVRIKIFTQNKWIFIEQYSIVKLNIVEHDQ